MLSMHDDEKELADEWGRHVRRFEAESSRLSGTLGRIREEGLTGAAIRSFGTSVPYTDFPSDVQAFHKAWLKTDDSFRLIIWINHKMRMAAQKKFQLMGMSKDAYYRLLNRARANVMYLMAIGEK